MDYAEIGLLLGLVAAAIFTLAFYINIRRVDRKANP